MKSQNVLFFGAVIGWIIIFTFVEFSPLIRSIGVRLVVLILPYNIILLATRLIDANRLSDLSKQTALRQRFMFLNLVNVFLACGLSALFIDLKYFSLALGLPSLAALIYGYFLRDGANTSSL
ncbi:MAG: hypothetical protein IPP66_14095 [Anaerolineales bacterium]|nr:hypothetical protein [Anaerolineales bacterium]